MSDIAQVIVVGAGPVGLFTALLLGQRGVSVTIYERWPSFYPAPRACGIDHEVVRMLQGAGLADEVGPLLDPLIGVDKTYELLDRTGATLLQIDWNRTGASGWAQMNMFYQPDLERLLVRRLAAMPNVTLRRGWRLVALQQEREHVCLDLEAVDGTTSVRDRARYVVGADGARSTVRGLTGVGQTDLGFAYDWLVVDVVPRTERTWKPYVVQHCDPARPTTSVASGPGRRRWEFMRLPGETNEALDTTEKVWELLARWQLTPDNATLERHTVYTFRGCWADDWKQGRILLAGDAAHLMPPFLGQGLCSGMRDAQALAWRLPTVLRGEAPDALLASYGPERSAHVQEIIRQAVEVGRLICMLDPVEVAARDAVMKAAMKDPSLALKPPPEPRLGARGLFQAEDAQAGYLSMQGRVRRGDREGLFDDVVGKGWQLLLRGRGRAEVSRATRDMLERLGGVVAVFGDAEALRDLDGTYGAWLDKLGAEAVLVRPDFYVFGTASLEGMDALVLAAWNAVHGQIETTH
jgi:2-polyprenyl-6-methoxyphenol hydroxylase-like FAD-dependent oxidoreductase